MGIRSLIEYDKIYRELYEGVLELAMMEDKLSRPGKEVTLEEARAYSRLTNDILSQCSPGTDIEDLIGLVVAASRAKTK